MNIFKKIGKFLQEVRVELKKVSWPTRREFGIFTSIVLSAVVVIGFFFWILDSIFLAVLRLVIG